MAHEPVDRKSFRGLIVAQALGAFNDNCFKALLLTGVVYGNLAASGPLRGEDREDTEILWTIGATVLFTIPFILFSTHAGRMADRFSKRSVTVGVKALEIVLMAAGALGFFLGNIYFLVAVLFLMALQSTIFSPSKYGILPEMLPARELPKANGVLELTTFLSIILGMFLGTSLYPVLDRSVFVAGILLTLLAFAGFVASLVIRPIPASVPDRRLQINPFPEMFSCFRAIAADRTMRLTALGIAYFWAVGAVVHLVVFFYGSDTGLSPGATGSLMVALAVGIGTGSWVAGIASHHKPELGLVPIGTLGMGLFAILLVFGGPGAGWYYWALGCLGLMGFAGGFFIIPLNVLLQQEAPSDQKGRYIAGVNLAANIGTLVALGILFLLMWIVEIRAAGVFLVLGGATIVLTFFVFSILPTAFFRFVFWCVTNVIYRIRIVGAENLPASGPALLVSNHVSYVDGLLILASTHRFIRFVVYKGFTEMRGLRWLARVMRIIGISPDDGPRAMVKSLKEASAALEAGELVCLFAEGQISRTGQLLPFRAGVEKIMKGVSAPIIPVYLDGVWGSIFSFQGGRFFWKWPRRIPYPVTIHFGKPLDPEKPVEEIRQVVQELGSEAFLARKRREQPLPWTMVRYFRRRPFQVVAVDSTGARASRSRFLIGAVYLARQFSRIFRDEPAIGMLLPPSVAAAVSNAAVALTGRPAVNLNFTAGAGAMRSAAEQCGITRVLTSRAFLEKVAVEVPGEPIFLEEIRERGSRWERLLAVVAAWTLPVALLRGFLGSRPLGMDDVVTVIFSSGSTGDPKGVELTHFNILSNTQGISQVFPFTTRDRLMGILPFFHSTGYTIGLWVPLLTEMSVIYHPNPLDARTVGHLARIHGATMLLATPTFLQSYTRRCQPEDFGSLEYAVTGAEKLTDAVRDAFREKFGLEPLEGYGTTECSPMVSVNVPDYRGRGIRQVGRKRGVGHPLPGVSVRTVDPETSEPRKLGEEGLLLVKGPNVMRGYLGQPELTAEVLRDGWYVTGDIAAIDEDGFINLTDRLSRFAKIAGEMVPNLGVEQALHELLGSTEQKLVVTSVPDAAKGERLAVVHVLDDDELAALLDRLASSELPNLWIPRRESFVRVEAIPVLGTGKVDLRRVREIAREAVETARG